MVVRNRELIPADMVLLASSESNGLGFVMTANLDGETNLKAKEVKKDFLDLSEEAKIRGAKIMCDLPNNHLEHFEGTYVLADGRKVSLTARNILLRGCMLRNTEWILGAIVYTSKETKIQMNAAEAPAKIGSMRRFVDRMTFFVFCLQVLCCMIGGIISTIYMATSRGKNMWYVWTGTDATAPNPAFSGFLQFWTYIISKSIDITSSPPSFIPVRVTDFSSLPISPYSLHQLCAHQCSRYLGHGQVPARRYDDV